MNFKMTQQEKDSILNAVHQVFEALKSRCVLGNATEEETLSALDTIHDFCGDISHPSGVGLLSYDDDDDDDDDESVFV